MTEEWNLTRKENIELERVKGVRLYERTLVLSVINTEIKK